jgi:hypothetical protein
VVLAEERARAARRVYARVILYKLLRRALIWQKPFSQGLNVAYTTISLMGSIRITLHYD